MFNKIKGLPINTPASLRATPHRRETVESDPPGFSTESCHCLKRIATTRDRRVGAPAFRAKRPLREVGISDGVMTAFRTRGRRNGRVSTGSCGEPAFPCPDRRQGFGHPAAGRESRLRTDGFRGGRRPPERLRDRASEAGRFSLRSSRNCIMANRAEMLIT